MSFLTVAQIQTIVVDSLKVIADVPQVDLTNTPLSMVDGQQQQVFLTTLKKNINAAPYTLDNGTVSTAAFYDVPLTADTFSSWPTVGSCIDWINNNQTVVYNN